MADNHLKQLFTFERLDAYQVAREALVVVLQHRSALKGLPGEIAGQMERAAVSTVANIAEAAGRQGRADQRNRYAIARAEANEAAAMIELAALYDIFSGADHERLRSLYLRVARMLTVLVSK